MKTILGFLALSSAAQSAPAHRSKPHAAVVASRGDKNDFMPSETCHWAHSCAGRVMWPPGSRLQSCRFGGRPDGGSIVAIVISAIVGAVPVAVMAMVTVAGQAVPDDAGGGSAEQGYAGIHDRVRAPVG